MEEAEIIVKRSILQGSAARGGRRSLLRRGETPTAMTRPGRGPWGPWPDLRADAPCHRRQVMFALFVYVCFFSFLLCGTEKVLFGAEEVSWH